MMLQLNAKFFFQQLVLHTAKAAFPTDNGFIVNHNHSRHRLIKGESSRLPYIYLVNLPDETNVGFVPATMLIF